jgi:hypothetical protein
MEIIFPSLQKFAEGDISGHKTIDELFSVMLIGVSWLVQSGIHSTQPFIDESYIELHLDKNPSGHAISKMEHTLLLSFMKITM